MKDKVVAILANKELKPAQKFNALLEKFRAHPAHTPSTMRYLNAAGYTAINLNNLEYDIKKLYAIKDSEVASFKAAAQEVATPKKTQEEINAEIFEVAKKAFAEGKELTFEEKRQLYIDAATIGGEEPQLTPAAAPEFSKGLPGNKEMIAWLEERKVEHTAKKKDDLLAEVEKQLQAEYEDSLAVYADEMKLWMVDYEKWLEEQSALAKAAAAIPQDVELPITTGNAVVNYDEMEYNDLKSAAAERAQQTGEAPANQKKATLLEYLKKKV